MIERLGQDLRYATRTFRRAPGFLLLTVLTTAVGVVADIVLALAGTQLLSSMLFGTSPTDAVTFVGSRRC